MQHNIFEAVMSSISMVGVEVDGWTSTVDSFTATDFDIILILIVFAQPCSDSHVKLSFD
jgi:hypothetical protein